VDGNGEIDLNMAPYSYKMIRSENFVAYFKQKLAGQPKVDWIKDEIIKLDVNKGQAHSKTQTYTAELIFDSRFDPAEVKETNAPTVLQHFKGWFIETEEELFDPDQFTMMDYRLSYEDQCAFTYILPFSKKTALVEYTFFSPELLKSQTYDLLLKKYIEEFLGISKYVIKETESGVIPMSSYRFDQFNTANYLRIGTAGGWVKASSGYSFKHAEKKSQKIAENLAKGKAANTGLSKARFKLYDRIFLNLLEEENHLGNEIFIQMYRKNNSRLIFRFLDEESNPFEELYLISRFRHAPFLRAVGREFF
jgi:lycopene beta-cyclase